MASSHANVHSQTRPHFCPVKGCPRSEGGKGFKRKNEMIRHGLVHQSPGYVCPFCPDREHKYPRPDNLQRYVFPNRGYRHSLTDYQQTRSSTSRGQRQGRSTAPRRPRTAARRRKSRAKKTSKPTYPSSAINSNITRFLLANDLRSLLASRTKSCIRHFHQLSFIICFTSRTF